MPAFAVAAALLSFERVFYIWVSRRPDSLTPAAEALSARGLAADRVDLAALGLLRVQDASAAVFAGWCVVFGEGHVWAPPAPIVLAAAATLVSVGQFLNLSVFYRLGTIGVFYGVHFGYTVPWTRAFPFSYSWLKHPQYVGTVLTIWGLFLAARFPPAGLVGAAAARKRVLTASARGWRNNTW